MIRIAIDGPAGSGKSTTAKNVASRLKINYIDTGAMYRACAYYMLEKGVDISNESDVSEELKNMNMTVNYVGGAQHILVNGNDVTGKLRTNEISSAASKVAVIGSVREYLVALQRKTASLFDVIMDGRDIGTCVIPDAEVKIFLTASVEERAKRRFKELVQKGLEADFEQVKKDIEYRDRNDTERAVSPLRKAEDAILLDTTDMTVEEVVQELISIINKAK